jgi:hypothetical protein
VGATSTITQCINDDDCCPEGGACVNDNDCLYWASGVLQNVPESTLTGWTLCFSDDYGDFFTPVSQATSQCDKAKLLVGCKPTGTSTLTLAAMGPRADVLFDCGQTADCKKVSNGVGFYFSDNYSWGFVPEGAQVQRFSCDVGAGFDNLRMCWHTGGGAMNSGYRCGNNFPFDASWTRVVYEAD